MRFWDTSAFVALLVTEGHTPDADGWLQEDPDLVLWTLTPVEVTSALWRRFRMGQLSEADAIGAERSAEQYYETAYVVRDVDAVKAAALRLLRVHPLRAADAMQLAAALAWADGDPAAVTLHTFDDRLARASQREGLRVVPAPHT